MATAGIAAQGVSLLLGFLRWQLFSWVVHEVLSLLADQDGPAKSFCRQDWSLVRRVRKRAESKKLSRKVRHAQLTMSYPTESWHRGVRVGLWDVASSAIFPK
jgi:hypothetical protein